MNVKINLFYIKFVYIKHAMLTFKQCLFDAYFSFLYFWYKKNKNSRMRKIKSNLGHFLFSFILTFVRSRGF